MDNILDQMLPAAGRRATRGVTIGWIVGSDGESPIVDFDGNTNGALEARSIVPVMRDDRGREVLMLFERNNASCPVIIGFLLDRPSAQPETEHAQAQEAVVGGVVKDVTVDGER